MFDTIVALTTAPIKSSLALIRLSGEESFNIASKIFSKDLTNIKKREALVGEIKDNNKIIDQVVCIVYVAPFSFTGENVVEFITHGSMLIVQEVISSLLKYGARMAKRGEFTQRAFLNHRIDLVQASAVNDLINANTSGAKDLALRSLKGESSKCLEPIYRKIADLLSLIEVNIDYPEYHDIEEANKEKIVKDIEKILPLVDSLLDLARKGNIIVNGIDVAILGKPNVGKSSLLNSLLKEDKAIVTSIPGTTRDIVEGCANIGGIEVRFIDTAGIHEAIDEVEIIGIKKAKEIIKKANLVIVVLSLDIDHEDEEILELTKDKKRIVVHNKKDKILSFKEGEIYISALNNDIEPLKNAIKDSFGLKDINFTSPSLTSAREIGLLEQAQILLKQAKEDSINDLGIDLVASNLLAALNLLGEITGKENGVDLEKEIFSRFCIGK